MANVTETDVWADGIYRIEKTDPVLGGEDGVSNKGIKQLANRTLYLKKTLEEMGVNTTQFNQLLEVMYTGVGLDKQGQDFNASWLMDSLNLLVKSRLQYFDAVPDTKQGEMIYVDPLGVMRWENNIALYRSVDCGSVVPVFNKTPLQGTLACNGAAYSRVTYAGLFSVIGETYGAGDGSSTFNVPNVPSGYALLSGLMSEIGTLTSGSLLRHAHGMGSKLLMAGGTDVSAGGAGAGWGMTGDAGVDNKNRAAGVYTLMCIKY